MPRQSKVNSGGTKKRASKKTATKSKSEEKVPTKLDPALLRAFVEETNRLNADCDKKLVKVNIAKEQLKAARADYTRAVQMLHDYIEDDTPPLFADAKKDTKDGEKEPAAEKDTKAKPAEAVKPAAPDTKSNGAVASGQGQAPKTAASARDLEAAFV